MSYRKSPLAITNILIDECHQMGDKSVGLLFDGQSLSPVHSNTGSQSVPDPVSFGWRVHTEILFNSKRFVTFLEHEPGRDSFGNPVQAKSGDVPPC